MAAVAPVSVERTHPRSADATRELYERHSRRIFGYCVSLLGSREDAEDAVQMTFMNAQRALRRGVVPEYELAWLFKIAKNVCNNRRMAAWRRGRVESARDLDDVQDAIASPERDASVSVEDLRRALSSIPARQMKALMLREWQGLSYAEIGKELGVSVAAVETLIFRARKSVASELERGETTRVASLLTTLVSVVRWLFGGSAAPLKVVAATATALTVAIVPAADVSQVNVPAVAPPAPAATGGDDNGVAAIRTPAAKHATPSAQAPAVAAVRPSPTAPQQAPSVEHATSSAATPAAGRGFGQIKPEVKPPDVKPPVQIPDPAGMLPPIHVPSVPLPPADVPKVPIPDVQVPRLPLPKIPVDVDVKLPPQVPPLPLP